MAPLPIPALARPVCPIVLGTAQDGGLPQWGGNAEPDRAARLDPKRRRLVASLLVVDPGSEERFLIDATPDIREQVEIADRVAPQAAIAAAPKPIHVPRERRPVVLEDTGPLVLVETRKDLSQVKLPFEQQPPSA